MSEDFNRKLGSHLDAKRGTLAEAITERHYQFKPELMARYGARGREKCLQDAGYHLSYLAEAISTSRPLLFADYIAWAKVMLAGFGVDEKDLTDNLKVMREALSEHLSADESAVACDYIDAGIEEVDDLPSEIPSALKTDNPLGDLAENYLAALLEGNRQAASRLILDAASNGTSIQDLYLNVFQRTQHEIGRLWQMNKLSVAQEHYSTAATQMIMSQLYQYIFTEGKNGRTMIATCITGDMHEIGARMVADFFEMDGWDTFYLGANVPTPSVIKTIIDRAADLIVISATMTFHVRHVRELITAIRASEEAKKVKIMVGGYPFNVAPDLWKAVGADAYSLDALAAVAVGNQLVSSSN